MRQTIPAGIFPSKVILEEGIVGKPIHSLANR